MAGTLSSKAGVFEILFRVAEGARSDNRRGGRLFTVNTGVHAEKRTSTAVYSKWMRLPDVVGPRVPAVTPRSGRTFSGVFTTVFQLVGQEERSRLSLWAAAAKATSFLPRLSVKRALKRNSHARTNTAITDRAARQVNGS